MDNYKNQVQNKLTKKLLDIIILQYLSREAMYGYQIITEIHKDFGVLLRSNAIYPLLALMEKKGYLKSRWSMNFEKPIKLYVPTQEGMRVLRFVESSLNLICKTMTKESTFQINMDCKVPIFEQHS